jgi:hydroxymethylglutaryl-CoA reductase
MANRQWILIAGPYGSGARSDEHKAQNLKALNAVAVEVLRRGHIPMIGVNLSTDRKESAKSLAGRALRVGGRRSARR